MAYIYRIGYVPVKLHTGASATRTLDELLKDEKELTRRGDELARRRRELPWVPGLYHEILNEAEQAKVMDDLVAWLDAHL